MRTACPDRRPRYRKGALAKAIAEGVTFEPAEAITAAATDSEHEPPRELSNSLSKLWLEAVEHVRSQGET